jgi:hypothetical protein
MGSFYADNGRAAECRRGDDRQFLCCDPAAAPYHRPVAAGRPVLAGCPQPPILANLDGGLPFSVGGLAFRDIHQSDVPARSLSGDGRALEHPGATGLDAGDQSGSAGRADRYDSRGDY